MKKIFNLFLALSFVALIFTGVKVSAAEEDGNLIPIMTSSAAPAGKASASSTLIWQGTTYSAFRAFSDQGEYASVGDVRAAWLQYEFNQAQKVNRYSVSSSGTFLPQSWDFQGSDNGTAFVTLHSVSAANLSTATNKTKSYSYVNEHAYKYYRINVKSTFNNVDHFGIARLKMFYDIEKPANVVAELNASNNVAINWNATQTADSYNIKRAETAGGPYTTIGTSVTNSTYLDSNLTVDKTYYYVVTANTVDGESKLSNEVSIYIPKQEAALEVLSELDEVYLNDTFQVQIMLKNVENIYAEDFNIKYDTTRFQLVGVEEAEHIGIIHQAAVTSDTLRFITASLGKDYGINGEGVLVNLTFKAIGLGQGKVDAVRGKIADNGTTETTLKDENNGEKIINVIKRTEFTLKHIGALGYSYGETKVELPEDLKGFLGDVGIVEKVDLLEVVDAVLSNPAYDFNA